MDSRVFWGQVNTDDTAWAEFDDFLKQRIKHPNGGVLGIDAVAVDSGDGQTMDRVLAFCHARTARRVVAIKGADGNRPAIKASSKGSKLFILGVDSLKAQLAQRLSRGTSVRFSDTLDARFFEELTSERRVVKYRKGVPLASWERIPGKRAEALDCMIYGMAVRGLVGVNLDRRANDLNAIAAPALKTMVTKSKWLEAPT